MPTVEQDTVSLMPITRIACVLALLIALTGGSAQAQAVLLHGPAAQSGSVVAMRQHVRSGVLSLTLSNGLTVHHRRMEGETAVGATLSGPPIESLAPTLRRAVADALAHPRLEHLDRKALEEFLEHEQIRLRARAGTGTITIRIDAPDASLACELLAAILRGARVDGERLEQFRNESIQRRTRRNTSSEWALQRVAHRALTGEHIPSDASDLDALTVEQVEHALRAAIGSASVEVGIATPLERARIVDLCERLLATLDERPEVAPLTADPDAIRPIEIDESVEGIDAPGVLIAYTLNASLTSPYARALRVASDLLESRLRSTLSSGRAAARFEAHAGPGRNAIVYAVVIEGPPDADDLIEDHIAHIGAEPVDGDEVARLGSERADRLRKSLDDPGFWAWILADRDRLGLDLDELLAGPHVYRTMTPERIRQSMSQAASADARIRIRVHPPE